MTHVSVLESLAEGTEASEPKRRSEGTECSRERFSSEAKSEGTDDWKTGTEGEAWRNWKVSQRRSWKAKPKTSPNQKSEWAKRNVLRKLKTRTSRSKLQLGRAPIHNNQVSLNVEQPANWEGPQWSLHSQVWTAYLHIRKHIHEAAISALNVFRSWQQANKSITSNSALNVFRSWQQVCNEV